MLWGGGKILLNQYRAFIKIGELLYNIALVSAVQLRELAICC